MGDGSSESDDDDDEDDDEMGDGDTATERAPKEKEKEQQPEINDDDTTNTNTAAAATTTGAAAAATSTAVASKSAVIRSEGGDYDYCDDFIDDSEFIDMIEHADVRKLKYDGFFISRGIIDRVDELIASAVPDKATRKRKGGGGGVDANGNAIAPGGGGGGAAGAPTTDKGQGGGEGAGGEEPSKKKQRKKIGDGGGSSAGGSPLPGGASASAGPRKQLLPYSMPDDVSQLIEELRELAAAALPLPSEGDAGHKGHRKTLPTSILEHLKAREHIFHRDVAQYKTTATKSILDELMTFLEPFSTKENMRLYVTGSRVSLVS